MQTKRKQSLIGLIGFATLGMIAVSQRTGPTPMPAREFLSDAAAYAAAVDSILLFEGVLSRSAARPDTVWVLDEVHLQPIAPFGASLGRRPAYFGLAMSGLGHHVRLVTRERGDWLSPTGEVIRSEARHGGSEPVVILGPIDFLGRDEAWARVGLAGTAATGGGNTLYAVELAIDGNRWRVTRLRKELQ